MIHNFVLLLLTYTKEKRLAIFSLITLIFVAINILSFYSYLFRSKQGITPIAKNINQISKDISLKAKDLNVEIVFNCNAIFCKIDSNEYKIVLKGHPKSVASILLSLESNWQIFILNAKFTLFEDFLEAELIFESA